MDIGTILKQIREIDLRPIREEAERQTWIAIIGSEEDGARDLLRAFYFAPRELPPDDVSRILPGPIVATRENSSIAQGADLIILVLEGDRPEYKREQELLQRWLTSGKKVMVIFNRDRVTPYPVASTEWSGARVLEGRISESEFLENVFVPALLSLLPDRHLSLARNFPLLRVPVARQVISDTSMANGGYSFSTGIAEIVPVLNIPFNVADMVILTKAQAFMVYRLGLVFGLSPRWQDHLAAFGTTIGAGFVWRTIARTIIGLVPGFGVVPKVAIAYAGTYAIGAGALQWYETGREVKKEEVDRAFRSALERGKQFAKSLGTRTPNPKRRLGMPFKGGKQLSSTPTTEERAPGIEPKVG